MRSHGIIIFVASLVGMAAVATASAAEARDVLTPAANGDVKVLGRRTSAAQVMRGPLVLAKGRAVGTSRTETLEFNTINKQPGWKLSLAPQKRTAANAAPWGAWNLTLEKDVPEKGIEKKTVPVADYWSVSCMDDPENWFSLWF